MSLHGQVSNSSFAESEALLEKVMDKYGDLDKLSITLQWTMDIPGNGSIEDVIEASRNGSAFQFEKKITQRKTLTNCKRESRRGLCYAFSKRIKTVV